MSRTGLIIMTSLLFQAGCNREFEPPPPKVGLSAIWPSSGFSGDPVALCGAYLDPEAALNEIAFGAVRAGQVSYQQPADWAEPDQADFRCEHPPIFARVPVLATEGNTSIQIANASGQALLPDAFNFRGPGHPASEKIQKVLHLRAGLWSLFAPPGIPAPAFGAVSQQADLISLFEPSLGLHLDFGQCALPLSGAVAMTELVIDLLDPDSWQAAFKVFGINAELEPAGGEHTFDVSMWAWDVDLKRLLFEQTLDPPQEVYLPSTADRQPFRPAFAWAFQRPSEPILHDLVVSHVGKPALAIFPVEDLDHPTVVELPTGASFCQGGSGERPNPIVDLVHDPIGQVFYVALLGSNEIWRVSVDGQDVARAWPPPDPTGYEDRIDCSWSNSSLALRRSHSDPAYLRLYVADAARARVRPMQPETTPQGDSILAPIGYQTLSLDALPYALTTGQFAASGNLTGEHLYVATQNALTIIDVTAYNPLLLPTLHTFSRVGEIPVPSNQGSSQSLITSDNHSLLGSPDTIAFADAHSDKVLFYTAGDESLLLTDVTIGATLPRLTSSYQGDRLYLTDALSNTIQVVDRDSGRREDQFLIASLSDHPLMGFGSTGMQTLRGPDYDLLMLPLLDLTLEHGPGEFERNDNLRYENIAFGRFADDLPTCSLVTTGMSVETDLTEEFHTMTLVSWDWDGRQDVPVLVLTRREEVVEIIDADGLPTGEQVVYRPRTWCLEIDPDAAPESLLVPGAKTLCDLVPEDVSADQILGVRPARRAPAIARLEQHLAPGQDPQHLLRLLPQDEGSAMATTGLEYPIAADFAPYITDLVVLRGGSREEPLYVVYLPLSSLGMVLEVTFDTTSGSFEDALIETGGTPASLYASPDGRRAYVVHPLEGRIDILRLECDPGGACDTLASTVDVGTFPYQVEFDTTGRYAFVIHLFSNDVTVIE